MIVDSFDEFEIEDQSCCSYVSGLKRKKALLEEGILKRRRAGASPGLALPEPSTTTCVFRLLC